MTQVQAMKIGILGLENAGKTSIIKTLQHTYQIGQPLYPTKNVERTFFTLFGQQGSVWDFGGQAIYRNIYLKNPDRFLSGIRYLFFVIDVQDFNRFPEALQYFKRVYEYSSNQNPQLIASILFHKSDPELIEKPEVKQRIDKLKKEIHRIGEDIELGFYETTSYDPLSVFTAFSLPIVGDQAIYSSLSTLFANFSLKFSIEYMAILVDEILELGSFRLKTVNQDFLDASMQFCKSFFTLEMDPKIRSYLFEGYRFTIVKGTKNDINYTVNFAHPLESDVDLPTEKDILALLPDIDALIEEYKPSFF